MKIILASGSPRRKEILEKIGLNFVVEETGFEEKTTLTKPEQIVKFFASEKAKSLISKYPLDLIIAADTIVVLGKKIMGKPRNNLEAKEMLNKLSGKTHTVMTGVSVIRNKKIITKLAKTKVKFKKLNESEINAYIKTKEPLDKAGGYGIQGRAGVFVKEINGEYFNIMGMPVDLLSEILNKFNISISSYWR